MIRLAVADLVVIACEALHLGTADVLDLLDIDAADLALADPVPPVDDPGERAGVLLFGLLRHRPLSRGNRRVAVLATVQFLAVNGWQLDLEPAEDLRAVLRSATGPADLTGWIRPRMCPTDTRPEGRAMSRSARKAKVFERMTDRARRVVVVAQEEARMHRHSHIGTEHLLLGLLHEHRSDAARALRSLGVDLGGVRGEVEQIIGRGRTTPPGHIPFTPRSKRALNRSRGEADRLGQDQVTTEHILLGVLHEGDGIAAMVLERLGLDRDHVRERVHHLVEHGEPPAAAQLDELRRATDAAIDAGDFPRAAALRARQRELLGHDAVEGNDLLRREVERLRGLLRRAGIDPDEKTPRTA